MLQSCILKIIILKRKPHATTEKSPNAYPFLLHRTFPPSAFLFSFLIHSSPTGLCWGDYEDAGLRHSVCIPPSIWVGCSPLCRLGNVKKWPCGKLGCDLLERQQLPAWLPGLQNITPWKIWGSLSTMCTDKLRFILGEEHASVELSQQG